MKKITLGVPATCSLALEVLFPMHFCNKILVDHVTNAEEKWHMYGYQIFWVKSYLFLFLKIVNQGHEKFIKRQFSNSEKK